MDGLLDRLRRERRWAVAFFLGALGLAALVQYAWAPRGPGVDGAAAGASAGERR